LLPPLYRNKEVGARILEGDFLIKEIEVDTFLKYMGEGTSKPVLVIGDDFKEYILKNEKIDDNGNITRFDCMFVNELLAYQIGYYLGVPLPESVVAYVDNRFIEDDPELRFAYRFEDGKYFASQKLPDIENNIFHNYSELINMGKPYFKKTWKKFLMNIDNKSSIANILAFDILIANFDRYNNIGNIIISKNGSRNIFAIDHGHAFFGPNWNTTKINSLNIAEITNEYINLYSQIIQNMIVKEGSLSGTGVIFKSLEEYIDLEDLENHSFMDVVQKIESINEELLDSWLNNIPNEWFRDRNSQITYYKKFILSQKYIVRHILQNMAGRDAFSNYRGGTLKWKQEDEKSHTAL